MLGKLTERLGDGHIRAAIHYLDSPIDYREYLPYNRPRKATPEGNRALFDESRLSVWITGLALIIVSMLIGGVPVRVGDGPSTGLSEVPGSLSMLAE